MSTTAKNRELEDLAFDIIQKRQEANGLFVLDIDRIANREIVKAESFLDCSFSSESKNSLRIRIYYYFLDIINELPSNEKKGGQ